MHPMYLGSLAAASVLSYIGTIWGLAPLPVATMKLTKNKMAMLIFLGCPLALKLGGGFESRIYILTF